MKAGEDLSGSYDRRAFMRYLAKAKTLAMNAGVGTFPGRWQSFGADRCAKDILTAKSLSIVDSPHDKIGHCKNDPVIRKDFAMPLWAKILSILMISIASYAKANSEGIALLPGTYDFDMQGSELTQSIYREMSIEILELMSEGIEKIDNEAKIQLEDYGIIKQDSFITDQAILESLIWTIVKDNFVDTNDKYDRTPLIIDNSGAFFYVNGSNRGSEVKRQCVDEALGIDGGLRCRRERYEDDLGFLSVIMDGGRVTAIEISVKGKPMQRYLRRN